MNTGRRRVAQCARLLMRCERCEPVNGRSGARRAANCGVSMARVFWGRCGYPSDLFIARFIGEDSLSIVFLAARYYTGNCITGGPSGNEDEKCRRA